MDVKKLILFIVGIFLVSCLVYAADLDSIYYSQGFVRIGESPRPSEDAPLDPLEVIWDLGVKLDKVGNGEKPLAIFRRGAVGGWRNDAGIRVGYYVNDSDSIAGIIRSLNNKDLYLGVTKNADAIKVLSDGRVVLGMSDELNYEGLGSLVIEGDERVLDLFAKGDSYLVANSRASFGYSDDVEGGSAIVSDNGANKIIIFRNYGENRFFVAKDFVQIGSEGSPGCLKLKKTGSAGFIYCSTLNGQWSCGGSC